MREQYQVKDEKFLHIKKEEARDLDQKIQLIKNSGLNLHRDVKSELKKSIQAREVLMVNNDISFRYDDLPGLGISKQQLRLKKKRASV